MNNPGTEENQGRARLSAKNLYLAYANTWLWFSTRIPYRAGLNIFERDWDVLVVLDACRTDLMAEIADDRPNITNIQKVWSVGSSTGEWLPKTFNEKYSEEIKETVYISANPYTESFFSTGGDRSSPIGKANTLSATYSGAKWNTVNADDFALLEEVWRYGWDDDLGTVPPRTVTDRSIEIARDQQPQRMIVHYMQPHQPFISEEYPLQSRDIDDEESSIWQSLKRGNISEKEVWDAYKGNLELVMDEIDILRNNIEAEKLVLTSDHGNAIGEWGMYDHPVGWLHPSVKQVPWVECSAVDQEEYIPDRVDKSTTVSSTVEQRLRDLGYQ